MMIHDLTQVKKVDLFYVLPLLFRRTKAGEKKFGPNLLTFSAIKGNHKSKTITAWLHSVCLFFLWKINKRERWEEQSYIAILRIRNCGETLEAQVLLAQHEKVKMLSYVVGVGCVLRERKKRKCAVVLFFSSLLLSVRDRKSVV